MDAITVLLYLYWTSDVLLALYGWPTTFDWISPPKLLIDLFQYGKCRDGQIESSWVKFIEIPKSWFKHFYFYGFLVSSFMVALTVGCFLFNYDVIGRRELAELFAGRKEVIDEYAVMIICAMMLLQHTRRIYECLFISVYSKGTMNILHYILGFLLYTTVQLCAISDGPKLTLENRSLSTRLQNFDLLEIICHHWNKCLGCIIFVYASYYHHKSHVILANLRKDRSGKQVLHRQHVIPRGGPFEYLSAPHFVCEILIYLAMGLLAFQSFTFLMGPVLFTVTNQTLMTYETHKWYKKCFKDYPKRSWLIPYIL
ncbi:polyprenol reductase-like [Watersipora subatra]|uniref:polyprenol reductase-like n=1 Tax=Watersipora subatra TaxID=2589382 RepID=UPI00355C9106